MSDSGVASVLTKWTIPGTKDEASVEIPAAAGEHTTIVGANGVGKSSLGVWLQANTAGVRVDRIIAHRKLWFENAGPSITSSQRESYENDYGWSLIGDSSRYSDRPDQMRTNVVLFDLLAAINHHNARSVHMFRQGLNRDDVQAAVGDPLLDTLNSVLEDAGLLVKLNLEANQTFSVWNESSKANYPIYKMSDGEKSAIILAGSILVAPEGSVQIIDEPERHLHRSISSGLIRSLLARRPDCHFVVITHDLELASSLASQPGNTFSLLNSLWVDGASVGWELRRVSNDTALPESAKKAILGGRRNVMFIEGEASSLDLALYSLLLPGWSLSPSGGAEQVMRNVAGLRASQELHWVNARGIVDGDGRAEEERLALESKGVSALDVSEIENLYFVADSMEAVATSRALALGTDPAALLQAARTVAFTSLTEDGVLERLGLKLAVAEVRRRAVDQIPDVLDPTMPSVTITFPSPLPDIMSRINAAKDRNDLSSLIDELPIRDTALMSRVARVLGFISISDYEASLRVLVKSNVSLASALRTRLGDSL